MGLKTMNTMTKTDEFKRAFFLGFAFVLGVDFARKNDQNLTENQFIINSLGAMDDKPWDESKHKRDKDGKFAKEGHSRVDSELRPFKKEGDNKYAKGETESKGRWITRLPGLKTEDDTKVSQALAPFVSSPKLKGTTIRQLDKNLLIERSDERSYEGKKKEGEPLYTWKQNGKELTKDEALKLETALGALKGSNVLSALTTGVKVRPDFATALGQLAIGKMRNGEEFKFYSKDTREDNDRKKHLNTENIVNHFSDVRNKFISDIEKDKKPEAVLSYFVYQTLCRADSGASSTGSFGATTLRPEHFRVEDGKLICEFHAKNGWWKLNIEDKFLKKYILEKLKTAEKGKPLFGVSYNKFNDYLKTISADVKLHPPMKPHDFRRVVATQKARSYFENAIKEDKTILEDEDKYSETMAKAINYAADALNDTASVVFEKYIAPQIFFKERPELADAYLKMNARKGR